MQRMNVLLGLMVDSIDLPERQTIPREMVESWIEFVRTGMLLVEPQLARPPVFTDSQHEAGEGSHGAGE